LTSQFVHDRLILVTLSHPSSVYSRRESFLATRRRVDLDLGAPAPVPMPKDQEDLPPFMSLKGSVSFETLKAITVKPFQLTHMSPVQAEVLPLLPMLAEPYDRNAPADGPPRDLLVKAKTGTGKTMAFLVPAIEARSKAIDAFGKMSVMNAGLNSDKNLEARARKVFAREHVGTLVISPTRELATQIADEALRLTHHHDGFEVRLFTGGTSKRLQMRDWMKGRRDIVVATPGRLRDLLNSEPEVARGMAKTQVVIFLSSYDLVEQLLTFQLSSYWTKRTPFLTWVSVMISKRSKNSYHLYLNARPSSSQPPCHALFNKSHDQH